MIRDFITAAGGIARFVFGGLACAAVMGAWLKYGPVLFIIMGATP